MVIRDAREADIAAIARFFRAIVAAGETYAYPEDLDDDGVADLWSEAPPGRTVVAVDAIAREVIAEIEREWTARLGARKMRRLRELLQELNDRL
jgi:hypothetical protein